MIEQSRRGFLSLLGVGIIAGPAIVRAASIMPVKVFDAPSIFQEEDLIYNGVIIRPVSNTSLIAFRKEMLREYVRQNLFQPYISDARNVPWLGKFN